jgi:hypothetical protein
MLKLIYILILLLVLSSCKNKVKNNDAVYLTDYDNEKQENRAAAELDAFEQILIGYYKQMESNSAELIKQTDILINDIKKQPDPNIVRWNKLRSLHDLRAETFYRMGKYQSSIAEIYKTGKDSPGSDGEFYFGDAGFIHLACNYVKLKDLQKAKLFLDSANTGWYITDYVVANYYEVAGKKDKALQAYYNIVKEESHDHYYFYRDALMRIQELKKANPALLTELFYPSERPDEEICQTDNERRTKIFDLIYEMPEVKDCKACNSVSIYKEPKQTKSSKYWIKVGQDNRGKLTTQYDFYVDTLTLEITYLDTNTQKELTLSEWRQRK